MNAICAFRRSGPQVLDGVAGVRYIKTDRRIGTNITGSATRGPRRN